MKAAIIIYAQKKIPKAYQHCTMWCVLKMMTGRIQQHSLTVCVYEKQNCITATEGNYQLHFVRNLNFIFLCVEAQLLKRNSP